MDSYKKAWEQIVKPPRFEYMKESLGPKQRYLYHIDKKILRIDFVARNPKEQKIQASLFQLMGDTNKNRPCIVYLHSHSANRLEGISLIPYIFPQFCLCVFDFTGCGQSDGEYVTLGLKEAEDAQAVIEELKEIFGLRNFFLWGRSMGAVSAIVHSYGVRGSGLHDVKGLVLDSPFSCAKSMVRHYFLQFLVEINFCWVIEVIS